MGHLRNTWVQRLPKVIWLFIRKASIPWALWQHPENSLAARNHNSGLSPLPLVPSCQSPVKSGKVVRRSWARTTLSSQWQGPSSSSSGPCPERVKGHILLPLTGWVPSPNSEGTARKPTCVRAGAVRSRTFLLGVKHTCWSPPVWLLFLSFNCFQTRDGWKGGAVYHIRTPTCCRRQWAGRFAQFKWDSGISACPFQSQSPLPSEIHRLLYTIPSMPQGL